MITQIQSPSENAPASQLLKQQYSESKFANKVKSINSVVMDHIFDEIQRNEIVIAEQQKPFKLRKNEQPLTKNQAQLSQLISKKQQIKNELNKIQLQQYKLHINMSRVGLTESKLSESRLNIDRMFRSELTEDQKQKIRTAIKNQKKFIKELKQKEKKLQQEIQQDRLKNLQIQENLKKQKCQERKAYWQKIRNEVNKRQEQRKQKQIQDSNRLKEVKKSKKLYQILQNSWKKKALTQQNQIKENIKHGKLVHKFDLAKIIEHQKQLQKIAKQKEEARLKNKRQFEEKVKLTLPKIQSKFLLTLKQEQKRKKIQEEEKEKKKFELTEKKNIFSQRVRVQYKPKIDQNLKSASRAFQIEQKVQKKPGLQFKEVINLGNDYMRNVHKSIQRNFEKIKEKRQQNEKMSATAQAKKPLYTNYLNDLKKRRNTEQIKENITNQVHRIMKNTSYSALEKIQRAKLVAKRLEGKENTKSSALISSINQKIKILKVLNENQ